METVRNAAVAGMFYPDEKDMLNDEVSLLLNLAKNEFEPERIFGLIAPHAGYIYSGKTAAYAYNLLKNRSYKKVIIISPSHREYFRGSSVYAGDGYQTPMGFVEVDKNLRDSIVNPEGTVFAGYEGHGAEHAIEVHLPFLSAVLGDYTFLPIVIGDQQPKFLDELALQIAAVWDDETLVIASSDLSHFYNAEQAEKLDKQIEDKISYLDYNGLLEGIQSGNCEACGSGPMYVLMKAADNCGFSKSKVLYRNNSAEASGINEEVVGYLSAVIYE